MQGVTHTCHVTRPENGVSPTGKLQWSLAVRFCFTATLSLYLCTYRYTLHAYPAQKRQLEVGSLSSFVFVFSRRCSVFPGFGSVHSAQQQKYEMESVGGVPRPSLAVGFIALRVTRDPLEDSPRCDLITHAYSPGVPWATLSSSMNRNCQSSNTS